MRKEAVFLTTIIGGIVAYEVSQLAFSYAARKEIGGRDKWQCQGIDGKPCTHGKDGGPARYQDGYFVQAAHYRDLHGRENDPDSSRGRILCTLDHSIEEIQRGNIRGANLLLSRGIYHWHHLKENNIDQVILSVEDIYHLMKEEGVRLGLGKVALEPYPQTELNQLHASP